MRTRKVSLVAAATMLLCNAIHAADYGIQISPLVKSAEPAKDADRQGGVRVERHDLRGAQRLEHEPQALRAAMNQQQNRRHSGGSASKPMFRNGFFPPTDRPVLNPAVTGFGSELPRSIQNRTR